MTPMVGARRQLGFSLLEVLVAFAILAVSLGVLLQIFSRASIATLAAAQYSQAASLIESRLAAVGTAIALEPGSLSGEPEAGFAWELTIVPVELAPQESGLAFAGPQSPVAPYLVTVTALWEESGRVRRLSLSTLRLGERLE